MIGRANICIARADDIRPYRSIFTLKLRREQAPALRLDWYGLM